MSNQTWASTPQTLPLSEIKPGDFVIEIPTQGGIRGVRVNSGLKTVTEDWETWRQSFGSSRRRRYSNIRGLRIEFLSGGRVSYPADFTATVRVLEG